jgi:quercetin dioxygenase-like cupin family protein
MLAYDMNDEPLSLGHGVPLRLRNEIELGFKQVKWIKGIEFVARYSAIGGGYGGYNEDHEFFGTDNRFEGDTLNSWMITNLDLKPHSPEILASTDEARAIALMIPAGESFGDHQVHESAWVAVIDGEVEIRSGGKSVIGSTGLVVAFAPNERHAVHARSDARLLLLLTPWPGVDHPGAMTLEQKANVRHDAAERRTVA